MPELGQRYVRFFAPSAALIALISSALWVGCADEDGVDSTPNNNTSADSGIVDSGDTADPAFARLSCDDVSGTCMSFAAGEEAALLNAINSLSDDTTIVLGKGTFSFDNALTIRRADGVTFTGQGIDETILDFSSQATQSNGVDAVGDDFSISHLTITDAKKRRTAYRSQHQRENPVR